MSTGDQSEYLRRKMAERRQGYEQGGQFMKSGYQKWAENERPARQGGAMKEGLATARDGGAKSKDILDRVKSLGEDMFSQYYKGSARHIPGDEEESESEEEGGAMAANLLMKQGRGYSGNGRLSGGAFTIEKKEDGRFCVMEDGEELGRFESMARAKAFVKAQRDARKPVLPPGPPKKRSGGMRRAAEVHVGPKEHAAAEALLRMKHSEVRRRSVTPPRRLSPPRAPPSIKEERERKKKEGKGKLEEHAADLLKMSKGVAHKMADGALMAGLTHKGKGKMECEHHEEGEGTEVRKVGAGKRSDRAALVKRVMKEKGLSLPAASKYVKEHGLYKK